MEYLNIIDEIFSSDIGFFMFGGLIVAMVISICLKMTKKIIAGGFISLLIYVLCEIGLNISADYKKCKLRNQNSNIIMNCR